MPTQSLESLENTGSEPVPGSATSSKGPPPASAKPRTASDSSLYSTAGKAGMTDGMAGLGSEGNSPGLMGMQGLALVQRGIQMLNLSFPENPGLVAVLADLTGRLQTIIPQLAAQSVNGAAGGGMLGMGMQQPPPGMGMAPGPLPPAPMIGAPAGGGMPPGAAPMGAPPAGPPLRPPPIG